MVCDKSLASTFLEPRGLTCPALGSWCTVGEQMAIFAMQEHTFTRPAGVSPPWVRKTHLQECFRKVAGDRRRSARERRWSRSSEPRGAYAPRSCVGVRTFPGEKTILAMRERTFTRAAGVSPPWFGKGPRLQCTLTDA